MLKLNSIVRKVKEYRIGISGRELATSLQPITSFHSHPIENKKHNRLIDKV